MYKINLFILLLSSWSFGQDYEEDPNDHFFDYPGREDDEREKLRLYEEITGIEAFLAKYNSQNIRALYMDLRNQSLGKKLLSYLGHQGNENRDQQLKILENAFKELEEKKNNITVMKLYITIAFVMRQVKNDTAKVGESALAKLCQQMLNELKLRLPSKK